MPPNWDASKNQSGRMAAFNRCGPMPRVWMGVPMAPARTIFKASCTAGTMCRSEKQIENIRPVWAATSCTRSNCSAVVTPGLSTSTSLPWRIAAIAISARWAGMAAQTIRSICGSSKRTSGRAKAGNCAKRSCKPAKTLGSLVCST